MGTVDRDGKLSGSLVDAIRRRVGAPLASSPAPSAGVTASGAPGRVSVAPDAGGGPGLSFGAVDDVDALAGGDDRPAPMRRMYRRPVPREPSPGMLGFGFVANLGWEAMPQRPFKPRGLYIVGALSTGDRLEQVVVGVDSQLLQSCAGVPAHFFATARSYEQIAKAVAAGDELPGWGDWAMVHPGQRIVIALRSRAGELLGPETLDLGMWGHVLL